VECTVYEDTGSFSLEDGVKFDADGDGDDDGEIDDPADPAIDPPPAPAPAPRMSTPMPPVASGPPPTPAEPPPGAFPLAAPTPTARTPQNDLAAPTVATPDATFHAKPLPWLWIGLAGAAVVVLLIGIIVSQLGGSKASAGSGSGSASAAKLPTVPPPAVAPDAGAPAITDSADAAVADVTDPGKPDIPVVAGTGDCEITVTSTPDEATVLVEGRNVGKTPLTTPIECGSSKIVVDRNRYERYEKKVRVRAGSPETLAVRLQRPAHSLRITSKPPGATVKVGRHSAGKTPVSVKVHGYETVKITATLKGYETWSSSLYIKPDTTSVNANLKRIPKKKTR
jgi:hypothetical protein